LLRVPLATYGWPKAVRLGELMGPYVVPQRGIVVGPFAATFELQALVATGMQLLQARRPLVRFSLHVDDLSVGCSHQPEEVVTLAIRQAAAEAALTFETELLLEFATDKSTVVASSARLARRVHAVLGSRGRHR